MTEQVKGDLLAVYDKLGGQRFLYNYAVANPDEFVRHLMRLVPPAPPEAPESAPIDTSPVVMLEAAKRIAFVLAQADAMLPRPVDVQMVELAPAPEPAFHYRPEQDPPLPPLDEAPVDEPPMSMPRSRERIEETLTETIESYRGSASEQAQPRTRGSLDPRAKVGGRRKESRDAFMAARKRDLL